MDGEWTTADEVFVKLHHFPAAGSLVPQHVHKYDHTTVVATGAVKVWEDYRDKGIVTAPATILIRAGTRHLFKTLEDNTTILCIHNAMRPDVAAVIEEHEISLA